MSYKTLIVYIIVDKVLLDNLSRLISLSSMISTTIDTILLNLKKLITTERKKEWFELID